MRFPIDFSGKQKRIKYLIFLAHPAARPHYPQKRTFRTWPLPAQASGGFTSYRPVVANGSRSGDRADLVEYSRPLTRPSHLSSAARPFAILNARRAIRDLVPQTPSAGPARNPSSISRFCAAIISLGGGFNLLAPCSDSGGRVGRRSTAWRILIQSADTADDERNILIGAPNRPPIVTPKASMALWPSVRFGVR
jgi:hypothetical protein